MFQDYLEVMLALDEGGGASGDDVARMTGMRSRDVLARLEQLEGSQLVLRGGSPGNPATKWSLTPQGKRVMRLGWDEYLKRVQYQNLGAPKDDLAA